VIWECQLRTQRAASVTLDNLLDNLDSLSKIGKEGRLEVGHDNAR